MKEASKICKYLGLDKSHNKISVIDSNLIAICNLGLSSKTLAKMLKNYGDFSLVNNQKIKTAILISGRGSNMRALIAAAKNENYPAEIVLVISNKETAPGLDFAYQNGIKTVVINHKNFSDREDFDREMARIIDENNCQIICLAGFMRLLSAWFTKKYQGRLINIHPSLLPNFKGHNAVEDALKSGAKISGCTVHFVTEEMDAGPIIKQVEVKILEGDTKEILASRILEQEHLIYPQSLKLVCDDLLKNSVNKTK